MKTLNPVLHKCGVCGESLRVFWEPDEEDWENDPDGDGDRAFREYAPCLVCGAVNKAIYTLSEIILMEQPREIWNDPVIPTYLG